MGNANQPQNAGQDGMTWTAVLGLLAMLAVSIGIWGAAIKAGIALLH